MPPAPATAHLHIHIITAGSVKRVRRFSRRRRQTNCPHIVKTIAHFTPCSSPEIDDLLTTIRNAIILPAYLPQEQRKKIWSPKHEKALQTDPIVIEIDGEVHKFRHMNFTRGDVPPARETAMRAIKNFAEDKDFDNLRPLIEGLYYAGYPMGHDSTVKTIRLCGQHDRIYDIIDCARRVKETGIRLASSEMVNELLHQIQMRAFSSSDDPDPRHTAQCLRWAEMVIDMLAEDEHRTRPSPSGAVVEGELPLDRDPQVLLARLHLAAALAQQAEVQAEAGAEAGDESQESGAEGQESKKTKPDREAAIRKTRDYAKEIVHLWPEGRKLTELQPAKLYERDPKTRKLGKMGYMNGPGKFVSLAIPLLHGLDLAIKVLESTGDGALAAQLATRRQVLADEFRGPWEILSKKDGTPRGISTLEKFYANDGSGKLPF